MNLINKIYDIIVCGKFASGWMGRDEWVNKPYLNICKNIDDGYIIHVYKFYFAF